MTRFLMTWELGGGLGHLAMLQPIALRLRSLGHQVWLAVRDLRHVHRLFDPSQFDVLQAPFQIANVPKPFNPCVTYAHLLHNVGFHSADELESRVRAWRKLFEMVGPDVIIADHSPTALLAAQNFPAKRVVIGIGFSCPPDETPLRQLLPGAFDEHELAKNEASVVQNINQVLCQWRANELHRAMQLYSAVDLRILTTFQELDHFAPRIGADYSGVWSPDFGTEIAWPKGDGQRILVYLKPFPALPYLVQVLKSLQTPTVLYVDGVDPGVLRAHAGPQIAVATEPINIRRTGAQCDVVVTNANHATMARLLLAGKPQLQIPLTIEQGLLADKISRAGLGLSCVAQNPRSIESNLHAILTEPRYREAASSVASSYANFDGSLEVNSIATRLLTLAM